MTWIEDDSHVIPDYIMNMPDEEVERIAEELAAQMRKERDIIRESRKKVSA
ncbi:MAG: hypothetical protein LBL98_04575 [Ruminococcus sp.]|jgi:hypothetical protein|nr:hypothetical protein [Ruminococcus sp.]